MNAPSQSESTALAVATRQQFDLSPQTFEQALTFAQYLADSEMVPRNFRGKAGDCLIAMQWGYEVGLKPLQALQNISVINGKPGLYGDAGKAILLAAGCIIEEDDIQIVERNQRGRCKITRPGRPPVERTFSLDNAKTAGLWNKEGPWRTHPWRQMAWRAFWFAARDAAADLLKGLIGAEEAIDLALTPQVSAPAIAQAPAPAGPPEMTADDLQKREAKIAEFYSKGKTPDEIAAFYATKFTVPDAIKTRIREMKPAAAGNVQDVTPKVSYAHVADKITRAASLDELNEAAALIPAVQDEQQRAELTYKAGERQAELAQED